MKFSEMSNETKASMTEEQIRKHVEIEMMEGDILKVDKPENFDVEMPYLKTETYYVVGNIYFQKQKHAEQFLTLNPRKDSYDWKVASSLRFTERIEPEITIKQMYIEDEIREKGQDLIEYRKQKEDYEAKKRKYDNYISARNAIADRIWSEHESAKKIIDERMQIIDTYNEYIELTNSDKELAYTFLVKHFGEEKVKEANITEESCQTTEKEKT